MIPTPMYALALSLLVFASACSSISTTRDPKVDLSKYKTYQWLDEPRARDLKLDQSPSVDFVVGYTRITRRPDVEDKLKAAIDKDLEAKGFRLASANPDFYVTFFGRAKDQNWVSTWEGQVPSVDNVPIIAYPGFDRSQARTYRDGTVLLVFYDAKTKMPSWTGSMTGVLFKQGADLATIERDVLQMTKEFPS